MNEQKRRKQIDGKWPCSKCKNYKHQNEFNSNSKTWNGVETICKECRSHKRKTIEEREKIWEFCIKKRYQVTKEEYNSLLEEQNYVCAICSKHNSTNKKLNIDHCHKTNKVRGLLCDKCNTAIGLLNDNTELLISAINYLK